MRCSGDVCKTVSALCDSGGQMTLVRSELLDGCEYQPVSKVQLRPFYGDSITANVVCMNLSCDDDDVGIYEHCAIVSGLNDKMILAEDTISYLLQNQTNQVCEQTDHDDHIPQNAESETMINEQKITDDVVCQAVDVNDTVVPPGDCDQSKDVIDVGDVSDHDDVLTENNSESLMSSSVVAEEQCDDVTLKGCFKMAEMEKGHFVVAYCITKTES